MDLGQEAETMRLSQEGKIGVPEAVALATMFTGAELFSAYPSRMADLGQTAGWLVSLVSVLVGTLGTMILACLMANFPGRSIVEVSEEVLGSWLSLPVSLVFLLYFLILTAITLRQYAERILTAFLPVTPLEVIMGLILLGSLLACYLGLEAIGRSAVSLFPLIIGSVLLSLVLVYPYWNYNNLFPLLGSGPVKVLSRGAGESSLFSHFLVLAVVYPQVQVGKRPIRLWLIVAALSASILVLGTLAASMVFPTPVLQENLYPMLQMARLVSFGRFIQRVELFFVFFWVLWVTFKVTLGLYASLTILTRTLKLPYHRPFLLPMAIIVFALGLVPSSFIAVLNIDHGLYWQWGWITGYAIPLLLLVVARLRGKGGRIFGDQT
jgi:spore germination protein KB